MEQLSSTPASIAATPVMSSTNVLKKEAGISPMETSVVDIESQIKENLSDDGKLGEMMTILNIVCSAIGVGALLAPTTFCGSGWPLGIIGILFFGVVSDWSSRALVSATVKVKAKSLEEMFERILGVSGKYAYCLCIIFMVFGAAVVYTALMGQFVEPMFQTLNIDTSNYPYKTNFRIYHLILSTLAGAFLLFKDLKLLSYTSIVKVVIMFILLILAFGFGWNESNRRSNHTIDELIADRPRWPVTPTLFGLMKAFSSWEASFCFHMGVSDMYTTLRNATKQKWKKLSIISCVILAVVNILFALIGMWSTIHMSMDNNQSDIKDACRSDKVFVNLYQSHPVMDISKILLFIVLLLSYPMICFFLKSYIVSITKSLFPNFVRKDSEINAAIAANNAAADPDNDGTCLQNNNNVDNHGGISESKLNIIVTFGVWTVVTGASLITDNVFNVVDVTCAVFGTMVTFIFPVIAWIQTHGGMVYIMSFGLLNNSENEKKQLEFIVKAEDIDSDEIIKDKLGDAVSAKSVDRSERKESVILEPTKSIKSMFVANIVVATSIMAMMCGLISVARAIQYDGTTNPDFPWRMNNW